MSTGIALQQTSSDFARRNARATLEKPISIKKYAPLFSEPLRKELIAHVESKDRTGFFVWGAKAERLHQLEKVFKRNTLVLFRRGTIIYRIGVALAWERNPELARKLWGVDADGEPWTLVFPMLTVHEARIEAAEINSLLKRSQDDHWQGLVVVKPRKHVVETVVDHVRAHLKTRAASNRPPN
jgi:hypothetical protein